MATNQSKEVIVTQAIVASEPLEPLKPNYSLEDVDVYPPAEGDILVEVRAAGICHTDNLLCSVPRGIHGVIYPKVGGHEGSGIVRAIGANVRSVKVGDRVLLSFYSCSSCGQCQDQHPAYCQKFQSENYPGQQGFMKLHKTDGELWSKFFGQSSFSHYSIVAEQSVINVESILNSDDELKLFAPLGCGFQTGMGIIQNITQPKLTDVIVILGMGAVGMGTLMTAKIHDCKTIVAVDRIGSRLELAEKLGATHIINTKDLKNNSLKNTIFSMFPDGVNIFVDTTGSPTLLEQALESICKLGKLVVVGVPPTGYELSFDVTRHINMGRSIVGCIEGDCVPNRDIPQMIKWYREGKFPIDRLVQYFNATDFQQAFASFKDGSVIKPVLVWT
ncbi:putative alcohol dehydrogenase [Talaromyces proteolyticus]|uniref:Alcohol dehydrogenase n=1 Tax=Talaromyces proteolyticus TaxID=1131652 RepID=A0AAD4L3P5_9EURO|nr:putative alcohol dehydrogenase [Talaromyces proteolyticus]KAH8706020.1 putative alcohol dehydrogenase [Talaromyces proteolyticus]